MIDAQATAAHCDDDGRAPHIRRALAVVRLWRGES